MRRSVWRRIRMHKDDRLAAFELVEDGLQRNIAEVNSIGVREENKAIQSENVQGVREFLQGRINIRQRETGETRKPVGPRVNEFGRERVAPARQRSSLLAIAKMNSWRAHRHDSNIDTGIVHEGDHCLLGPIKRHQSSDGSM